MDKLILASASPRRRELLETLKIPFEVIVSNAEENLSHKHPLTYVKKTSELKCREVAERYPDRTILSADTIVTFAGKILEKPADREEAEFFLKMLSNKTHKVITAFTFYSRLKGFQTRAITTKVKFSEINSRTAKLYLNTGEWKDAAGAYKIQGKSQMFIKSIKGSYSNVVGLPLNEIYGILRNNGYPLYTSAN